MTLLSTSAPLHSVGSVISALRLVADLYGSRQAPRGADGLALIHPDGIEVRAWRDDDSGQVLIDLHPCTDTAEALDDDA